MTISLGLIKKTNGSSSFCWSCLWMKVCCINSSNRGLLATDGTAACLSYSCALLVFFSPLSPWFAQDSYQCAHSVNWLLFLSIRELIRLKANSFLLFLPSRSVKLVACPSAPNGFMAAGASGRGRRDEPAFFHGRSGWALVCSICETRPGEDSDWSCRHVRGEIDFCHEQKHMGNYIQSRSDHMILYLLCPYWKVSWVDLNC